ncbi:MAG: hypothetical protein AAF525_02280 [Pseudomonadota bacterium]
MAIEGGTNIAMKVPASDFESVVTSYRDLGLPVHHESDDMVSFQYGPVQLHIDRCDHFSQAEVWLELITDDLHAATETTVAAGFTRCDEIEDLGSYEGFWVKNPASVVHLMSAKKTTQPPSAS